jgi:hypothetical protein
VRTRPLTLLAPLTALAALYALGSLVSACGAGASKDGTSKLGGDGSVIELDADQFGCGACIGQVYTPCTAGGGSGAPVTCEDPLVCVPNKGCLACAPGGTYCVANDVHACNADGTLGNKVGACDPSKGEICAGGVCKTECQAAADSPSNVGCEFWAVDLDNLENNLDKDAESPWGVVLTNAGSTTATVTIEQNDGPPGGTLATKVVKTLTIKANELSTVIMPTREVDCTSDPSIGKKNDGTGTCLSSNAFRITSTVPLVAYQFNAFEPAYSNDASLLLPRNGLGTQYRILTYNTAHPVLPNFPGIDPRVKDHAFVTIIGTTAGTTVTIKAARTPITLGGPVKADIPIGGTFSQTLGPFDVLNLESKGDPGDLTGTIVTATAPISVFEGTEGSVAPFKAPAGMPTAPSWDTTKADTCCVDHLEEQAFPITAIGKKFIVPHSPIRSTGGYVEPDLLRFMGVAEPATVTTNLPAPFDHFTLAVGEMKETWTQGGVVVSSTAPVSVAQILVSSHTLEGSVMGDPSLTIFPSVEQYRTNYLFLQPPKWTKSYVVISTPKGSDVTIDGNPTSGCEIFDGGTMDGVQYEARSCQVTTGIHRVVGSKPFGVTAYGYGNAGSYAFTGGADVKPIYVPPPLY